MKPSLRTLHGRYLAQWLAPHQIERNPNCPNCRLAGRGNLPARG